MRSQQHDPLPVVVRRVDAAQSDHDLLIAILERVTRIEQQLLDRRSGRPPDRWDDTLITTIAESTQGRYFTARELCAHAHVDPTLKRALDDACIASARQCGKWLRKLEGHSVAGIVIERTDIEHRDGLVWCARVSNFNRDASCTRNI